MKRKREGRRQDYEVGYCKPPVAMRFRKGQSGNPRGRPRGSRNVGSTVLQVLERKVAVLDGEGQRKVPLVEAMLLKAAAQAVNGDARSLKLLLELARRDRNTCVMPPEQAPSQPLSFNDKQIIRSALERLARNGDYDV